MAKQEANHKSKREITENENPVSVGLFLRTRREITGLSQADVAAKLGYSTPQFISNWERGISSPPLKVLKKLADIYEIDQGELFDVILGERMAIFAKTFKRKFYG